MPLAIIKEPNQLSYSEEPILLSLKASNVFTDALNGVNQQVSITFSGNIINGKKITFLVNGESITFTCIDNYVETEMADTFPSQGNSDFDTWSIQFVNAIAINYFFRKRVKPPSYDFNNQKLTFETVNPTTDFQIQSDIVAISIAVVQVGVYPSVPIYEIIAEINLNTEGLNDSITLPTLSVVPETNQAAKSDFYLEKFLDDNLTIEPPISNVPHLDNKRFKRYFVYYTEKYGNPAQERLIRVTEVKWVLKGKFDWVTKQHTGAMLEDYLLSFKTNQPSEKTVTRDQSEYLYFFNNQFIGKLRLYVVVKWTGGSETTHSTIEIDFNSKQYHVLPVGWKQLGIVHPNFPEKQPISYQVSLAKFNIFGFNNHYSNIQKFNISNNCDGRYLIFQNNAGGMDTIRVLDNKSLHIIGSTKETMRRIWHRDKFGQIATFNRKNTQSFKVQTGMIDRLHAAWLKDLFESEHVWEIDASTGIYIPIIITTDKVTIIDGKDDLYDIQFEFQYAIER